MKILKLTLFLMTIIIIVTVVFLFKEFKLFGAGTLGGFDNVEIRSSKQKIVERISLLYSEKPEHKIPDKWQKYNTWSKRGYDFLDSRIFYFNSGPEEMYYVTFIGDANDSIQQDTTKTTLAIRAVFTGYSWIKEETIKGSEKKRIQTRFKEEIVSNITRDEM